MWTLQALYHEIMLSTFLFFRACTWVCVLENCRINFFIQKLFFALKAPASFWSSFSSSLTVLSLAEVKQVILKSWKKEQWIPSKMPLDIENGNSISSVRNGNVKNGQNSHSYGTKLRKNHNSFSSISSSPPRASSPTFSISES